LSKRAAQGTGMTAMTSRLHCLPLSQCANTSGTPGPRENTQKYRAIEAPEDATILELRTSNFGF